MSGQAILLFETASLSRREKEISALDEMFAASRRYRSSREYMEMLCFISRFPKYSPFNCFLLHSQNPAVSYVATARSWEKRFGRRPKRDARPLVILAPMSPVLFVYDLKDTEGRPVPRDILRPFETQGSVDKTTLDRTVHNCGLHRIEVRQALLGHYHGGSAIRLTDDAREHYRDMELDHTSNYLILLSRELNLEDEYSSLVHELGHILCGHLGTDGEAWWRDRRGLGKNQVEIEAESIAFLVCRRKGLLLNAEKYLSGYADEDREIPAFSLNAVFQATDYIEQMGQSHWEKPRKQSRHKKQKGEGKAAG